MQVNRIYILVTLIILTLPTLARNSDADKQECPIYGFSLNEYFEEISVVSETPLIPTGNFVMLKQGEQFFLEKIPRPVKVKNYKTNEDEILPITNGYCWYIDLF